MTYFACWKRQYDHDILKEKNNIQTFSLQVLVRGGNELEVRVVGHSTVFHAPSRSLLVYGGIRVDIARYVAL